MAADEIQGLHDGFSNWTTKNLQTGLNARYCELDTDGCGTPGSPPNITVKEGTAINEDMEETYSVIQITVVGGYSAGANITISNRSEWVLGRVAYKKFVQHELGHFHGMGEAIFAPPGSTVMRYPAGHHGVYLPDEPTQCDADKALERAQ